MSFPAFGPRYQLLANALIGEQYEDQFRTLIQTLDELIAPSVINATQVSPPGSPAAGVAYLLIGGTPTGAWAGQQNNIAWFNSNQTLSGTNTVSPSWQFITPLPGFVCWNVATQQLLLCTAPGTWTPLNGFAPVSPVPYFADVVSSSVEITPTSNENLVWSLNIPSQITVSNFVFSVETADNSAALYNLGLFSAAGSLVAQTGAIAGTTFAPATGVTTIPFSAGAVTLPAGQYFLAWTCVTATCELWAAPSQFTPVAAFNAGTTATAVLPSTISAPTVSWTNASRPAVALY